MSAHPAFGLDERRCAALAANDTAALAVLLDEQLVYVHSIGLVQGREDVLDMFAKTLRVDHIERTIEHVAGSSDLVLLTMTQLMRFRLAADPSRALEARTCATAAWRRRGDDWLLLHFQATALPLPNAGA